MSGPEFVSVCLTDFISRDAVYPVNGGEIYRLNYVRFVGGTSLNRPNLYVGFSAPPAPKLWRVMGEFRNMTRHSAEMLDIAFPTREAAIVYAVMLLGSK